MPGASFGQIQRGSASCRRASCWQGEFYCDAAKTSGTVEITFGEAIALKLEHPNWLLRDENMKHVLRHGEELK